MARRSSYNKVNKKNQIRAEHLKEMGMWFSKDFSA